MNPRTMLLAAGILGATGVALGAFGAHGLREALLARGMTNAWESAARYHLLHSVALLALGATLSQAKPAFSIRWLSWTARCWIFGVILFSGSLYGLALGGPRWLGPITPIGGLAFMAGWLCVFVAALKQDERRTDN